MPSLHHSSNASAFTESNGTRRIYEQSPFPDIPLARSSEGELDLLFVHNLVTPFYLRDQTVISAERRTILDAGCGTGFKSCILATANPGTRVLGIDFSAPAVHLARERAEQQGLRSCEFRVCKLEDLAKLGETFDYINCDEIMYMLPDPVAGLRAVASVLKPDGIARVNFHSFWGRQAWYRAQEASRLLGIFQLDSCAEQVARLKDLMGSLQPHTDLALATGWQKGGSVAPDQEMLNNALLNGDAGSTVAGVFGYVKAAGLGYISMVDWRSWELSDLWTGDLPPGLSTLLSTLDEEQRLCLFELLHPVHRLIDVWCATTEHAREWEPLEEWPAERWHRATVHLHPQLCGAAVKKKWKQSMAEQNPLNLHSLIRVTAGSPVYVDSQRLACLYPLFEGPKTFDALVDRWLTLNPIDPVTLVPHSPQKAECAVRELVAQLELFLFLLVEHP